MDQQPITDFGTIVNNNEAPTIEEAKLILKIPHSLFDQLLGHANKRKFPSVEAFASFVLSQAVNQKIGAPVIDAPAELSGQSTGKITGPSNSGLVRRA